MYTKGTKVKLKSEGINGVVEAHIGDTVLVKTEVGTVKARADDVVAIRHAVTEEDFLEAVRIRTHYDYVSEYFDDTLSETEIEYFCELFRLYSADLAGELFLKNVES